MKKISLNLSNLNLKIVIYFLFIIFLLINFAPDLKYISNTNHLTKFTNDWDGNNINYWGYLISNGFIPYKDFWYPYSGLYIFSLGNGVGEILKYFYILLLFFFFFINLYKITNKISITIIFLLIVIFLAQSAILPGYDRYLLSIILVLSYINYFYQKNISTFLNLILFFSLAYFLEYAQLIYTLPGLAIFFLINFFEYYKNKIKINFKLLILPFSFCLICLLFIYYHSHTGQLIGYLNFIISTPDMASSSQIIFNLDNLIENPFSNDFLIIVFSLISFLIGTYLYIVFPTKLSSSLFILGTVNIMVLNKHLVRPINSQFIIFFITWIFLYFNLFYNKNKTYFNYYAVIFLMICIFNIDAILKYINIKSHFNHFKYGINRIDSSFKYLFSNDVFINRFNLNNFSNFEDEKELINLLRKRDPNRYNNIFAMTDNQVLYIFSKAKPFYHSNVYNQSPIYDQLLTVKMISIRNTDYIIVDKSKLVFDLVPNIIRLPILYNYIIENYEEFFNYKNFIVLKQKKSSNIDYKFWGNLFGSELDLKSIPLILGKSNYSKCISPNEKCLRYLSVEVLNNFNEINNNGYIKIINNGVIFNIKFSLIKNQKFYLINLDRLWFFDDISSDIMSDLNFKYSIEYFATKSENISLY